MSSKTTRSQFGVGSIGTCPNHQQVLASFCPELDVSDCCFSRFRRSASSRFLLAFSIFFFCAARFLSASVAGHPRVRTQAWVRACVRARVCVCGF